MYITTLSVKKGLNDAFLTSYFHVKYTWQVKLLKHGVDFAKYEFFIKAGKYLINIKHPPGVLTVQNQYFPKQRIYFCVLNQMAHSKAITSKKLMIVSLVIKSSNFDRPDEKKHCKRASFLKSLSSIFMQNTKRNIVC